ncbi:hypothetical protein GQ457_07G012290 [Hibiscus cannabinus]
MGPLLLASLCDRFFKGHERLYSIYVHALPSAILHWWVSAILIFYRREIPSEAHVRERNMVSYKYELRIFWMNTSSKV